MRKDFHHQLEVLRADLATMCGLAGVVARRATVALLDVDADAAGQALDGAEQLNVMRADVERRAVSILALEAPVAGDLRATVTAIQIASAADRMGGLAAHVARLYLASSSRSRHARGPPRLLRADGRDRRRSGGAPAAERYSRVITHRRTAASTTMGRWRSCTATFSGSSPARDGPTNPRWRSTSCCSAGSMDASPLCQARSRAG